MKTFFPEIVSAVRQLSLRKKLALAGGAVLALVLVTALAASGGESMREVAVDGGPEARARAMVLFTEADVPFRVGGVGAGILVPESRIADAEKVLASQRFSGRTDGFEILDKTDFLASTSLQKMNYQRALQGELARAIRAFEEVRDARVFVALPRESVFVRDSRPATASVVLDLSAPLTEEKTSAIVHLVANAVETLEPQQVTVVDTAGSVWARGSEGVSDQTAAAFQSLTSKARIERDLEGRIQGLLVPIAGQGKTMVRVFAELDPERVEIDQETLDPAKNAVRHRRVRRAAAGETLGMGSRLGGTSAGQDEGSAHSLVEESVEYAISKTVRRVVRPANRISRLSVSVILDSSSQVLESGTQEALSRIEDLVKNAMGFTEERGDRLAVRVLNFSAPFQAPMQKASLFPETPLEKTVESLIPLPLAGPVLLGLVLLLALLGYRRAGNRVLVPEESGPVPGEEMNDEVRKTPEEPLEKHEMKLPEKPFSFLETLAPERAAALLGRENAQVIALALSHLTPEGAAPVFSGFDEDLQGEIAHRLRRLGPVPEDVVREISEALKAEIADPIRNGKENGGPSTFLDAMLQAAGATVKERVRESINADGPETTESGDW